MLFDLEIEPYILIWNQKMCSSKWPIIKTKSTFHINEMAQGSLDMAQSLLEMAQFLLEMAQVGLILAWDGSSLLKPCLRLLKSCFDSLYRFTNLHIRRCDGLRPGPRPF